MKKLMLTGCAVLALMGSAHAQDEAALKARGLDILKEAFEYVPPQKAFEGVAPPAWGYVPPPPVTSPPADTDSCSISALKVSAEKYKGVLDDPLLSLMAICRAKGHRYTHSNRQCAGIYAAAPYMSIDEQMDVFRLSPQCRP